MSLVGSRGEVSPEMALQAFSLAIAPLPGVVVPPGGADRWVDATMANWWLDSVRDSITPEQRTAADAALAKYAQPFDPVSGSVDGTAGAPVAEAAAPEVCTRYFANDKDDKVTPANPLADSFHAYVIAAKKHLHHDPPPRYAICLAANENAGHVVVTDIKGVKDDAVELCVFHLGTVGLDPAGVDLTVAAAAVRCFMPMAYETLSSFRAAGQPGWLYNGLVLWGAFTLVYEAGRPVSVDDRSLWQVYLTTPEQDTMTREGDAIGFWAQVQKARTESGVGDLWTTLLSILRAGERGLDIPLVLATLTNWRFQETWAASYFRDKGRSRIGDWDVTGPGITSDIASIAQVRIGNDTNHVTVVAEFATKQEVVLTTADVTVFTSSSPMRLSDGGVDLITHTFTKSHYCTREGGTVECTCPKGTKAVAKIDSKLGPRINVALDGSDDKGTAVIQGLSMAQFCKPDPAACALPTPSTGAGLGTIELAAATPGPTPAPVHIPAGTYEGTVVYTAVGPQFLHDGNGKIRFTVDADGKVKGTWDLRYTVTIRSAFSGTGTVAAGIFAGTGADLHLTGTNVVDSGHSTLSVPFPDLPLTVSATCDSRVLIRWERNVNGTLQQITIDAHPAVTP